MTTCSIDAPGRPLKWTSVAASLACCVILGGCVRLGPTRLDEDQLNYSRALSEADKRQTLLNVVRLRYADMPTFLNTTQVIAGYQVQSGLSGSFQVFPNAATGTSVGGSASTQIQISPTFTFQPESGEDYAQSFLRPLSPNELLPLAQGGMPIDVLLRLAVQSVGPLQNSTGLEQPSGAGSPDYFLLLHDLRTLQIAGLLAFRTHPDGAAGTDKDEEKGKKKDEGKERKTAAGSEHVYVTFAPARAGYLANTMAEAKRLLDVPQTSFDAEIIYGQFPDKPGQIAILTRSMLGVLAQLAFKVEVPAEDVRLHRTVATVGEVGVERRPVVVIHSGSSQPDDAFTVVSYQGRWFWIEQTDFDSKLAFSLVNILLALARTSPAAAGTIITIPAG